MLGPLRGNLLSLHPRPGKVGAGGLRDPLAQLLAQRPRPHLVDGALGTLAQLKRAERHPDQPVHRQPEVAEHVLDLTVLALADRKRQPDVAPLRAIDRGLDRAIAHTVDGDATAQRVERTLLDPATRAHAVA